MPVFVRHTKGVGINSRFVVELDGKPVASIYWNGRRNVVIRGLYGVILGQAPGLAAAKTLAEGMHYQGEAELFELACKRIEGARRAKLESWFGPLLARLFRETLDGSNSARDEAASLLAEIDRAITDRTHSTLSRSPSGPPFERVAGQEFYTLARFPSRIVDPARELA